MSNAPECEICGASVAKGASLYRNNPKGRPAQWRCFPHMDKLPPKDVVELVDIIEDGQ